MRPVCPSDEWLTHISSLSIDRDSLILIEGASDLITTNIKYDGQKYPYSNSGFIWTSDNPAVATVNKEGVVLAISNGIAHITVALGSLTAQLKITVIKELDIKHEYVDLGLSVMWATCNVGAEKPEEYGNFYAWGEILPKQDYYWDTYKWCNGASNTLTKYNNDKKYGEVDNKTTLEPEDDVAHVKWGENWRIPTEDEIYELILNCKWEKTTLNNIKGYLVTSKKEGYTDRSIFLPGSGYRIKTRRNYPGDDLYYWGNMLSIFKPDEADFLIVSHQGIDCLENQRCYGQSVRPVYIKSNKLDELT